jgi:hypothetical protein
MIVLPNPFNDLLTTRKCKKSGPLPAIHRKFTLEYVSVCVIENSKTVLTVLLEKPYIRKVLPSYLSFVTSSQTPIPYRRPATKEPL